MKINKDAHQDDGYDSDNFDNIESLEDIKIFLEEFLDVELKNLDHQINFTKNIISTIESELSILDKAQLFRTDKYRVFKVGLPDSVSNLIEDLIQSGNRYESLLQKTCNNYDVICNGLKSVYSAFLQLSINIKSS